MIKKIIQLFIFLFFTSQLYAQQEAMYTHYMYNTLGVNPAYAGSRDALTLTALHRSQWLGFQGAPNTQTLTMHTPVYGDAVNLGLSLINDRIGPVKNTGVFIDYAYKLKLSEKSKLALGLKAGFNTYSANLEELSLITPNDIAFSNIVSTLLPNIGFGAYYSTKRFYAGFSVPKIIENNFAYAETNVSNDLSKEERHYYAIFGAMIPLTQNIDLKPTSLFKMTAGAPVEMDLSAQVVFYEKFTVGAMYRTGDALGLLVGLDISSQFNVGYSFDWSFGNSTMKYNYGSHEIMLRYDFLFNEKTTISSPRYF